MVDKVISDSRITHMHGVAEYMYSNAEKYNLNKEEMYILGLNHDIGYLNGKDSHEHYGEILMNSLGFKYSECVFWNGLTPSEYKDSYSCFNAEIPKEPVLLWGS